MLGGAGAVELWNDSGEDTADFGKHPFVAILLVKVFFWLTVISHQIIHALAFVHYGRRVREFGFTMLHGFIPTFYADVTDIFMGTRRARIMAAVSGPLVHLFLGALYFWIASLLGPGLLKGFLAATAILQIQSLFVALYPFCFLEMDGYHVLVDLLGMPTLNHDAVDFVRESPRPAPDAASALDVAQEIACLAYFVLSAPLRRGLRPAEPVGDRARHSVVTPATITPKHFPRWVALARVLPHAGLLGPRSVVAGNAGAAQRITRTRVGMVTGLVTQRA